jgi:hypothetical protein
MNAARLEVGQLVLSDACSELIVSPRQPAYHGHLTFPAHAGDHADHPRQLHHCKGHDPITNKRTER